MAVEVATAYVTLIPSLRGAQGAIARELGGVDVTAAGRDVGNRMGNGIAGSLKSLIGPAIALAGVVGVSKFVTDSVKALSRIETINTQTATAIESTGNSANVTAKEIEDLAGSLENMTATEAESIQEGANLLLTFKNIKNGAGEGNDIFNQTTMAMTDMARAMGTDAKGGAIQLGKALNDPTAGIAALTRVGITFSDEQKTMISGLQESGDLMGAQKIILAELQSQFGGSAAAYADTFQGRIDLLGHALGTFGEAVSVVVLPAVKALAVAGADALNWAAELFTNDSYVAWGEGVGASITSATGAVSGIFSAFRDGVTQSDEGVAKSGVALWAENIGYSLAELAPLATAVFGEVTGGFKAMGAAFRAGDGEITSAGFAGFLETIGAVAREIWDVLAPAFKEIGPQVLELLTTISPLGIIFKALQPVLPQLGAAIGALAQALGGVLAAVLPIVVDLVGSLVAVLSTTLATVLPVIATLLTTVGTVLADTLIALLPVVVPLISLVADAIVMLIPLIAELAAYIGAELGAVLVQLMPVVALLAEMLATVLGQALGVVMTVLPILVQVAMQLLTALLPLIPAILEVVTALLPLIPIVLQLVTALLPVWVDLMNLLIPVVVWLVDLLVAFLVPVIGVLAEGLVWLVGKVSDAVTWFSTLSTAGSSLKDTLTVAWTAIKDGLSTAWTYIKNNVFAPFATGIEALGTAFGTVKDVIASAWTAIQDAATGPVNFIIETVYTNGIKKLFDTVAEKLGLDLTLPVVGKISAPSTTPTGYTPGYGYTFATGGVLPGYTPGRDVHEFFSATAGRLSLSGGEAIMRPEFTRAVGGPAGVARLNAAAIKGQAFASGGVWGWVKEKVGAAWDFTTNAASAVGNFMKDPVKGALEVISKPVQALFSQIGGGTAGEILTGIPKALLDGIVKSAESIFGPPRVETPAAGVGAGLGGFAPMGYRAMMSALQQLLPGARVTSTFRPGDPNMHGKGRAIDIGSPTMGMFNALLAAYPNAYQLLYSPAGAQQITWAGRRGNTSGALRADHFDHIHWAMKNGGVLPKLYDEGGWLPPGRSIVENRTGRPEPVFTGDQFDKMTNNPAPLVGEMTVMSYDPESAARAVLRKLEDAVQLNDLAAVARGIS